MEELMPILKTLEQIQGTWRGDIVHLNHAILHLALFMEQVTNEKASEHMADGLDEIEQLVLFLWHDRLQFSPIENQALKARHYFRVEYHAFSTALHRLVGVKLMAVYQDEARITPKGSEVLERIASPYLGQTAANTPLLKQAKSMMTVVEYRTLFQLARKGLPPALVKRYMEAL